MIDTIFSFGQGLMGSIWPGTVWTVLWTLIKIVCVLLPLMACVAYLTLFFLDLAEKHEPLGSS